MKNFQECFRCEKEEAGVDNSSRAQGLDDCFCSQCKVELEEVRDEIRHAVYRAYGKAGLRQ